MAHTSRLGKVGRRWRQARPQSDAMRVVARALDGQVRLRIERGERPEVDVPLSTRQALLLASDILTAVLVTSNDGGALPRDKAI